MSVTENSGVAGALPALYIVQLGLGGVGQALVDQYIDLRESDPQRTAWLGYLGLADRSGLCLVDGGWSLEQLRQALEAKRAGQSLASLAARLDSAEFVPSPEGRGLPPLDALRVTESARRGAVVVVDVTAERRAYDTLLRARELGAHVVMCNKWTLAEPIERMDAFALAGQGEIRYETTVGAALPVIGVLDMLLSTRDEVDGIEAAISGTLGYVCSEIEHGTPFSQALRKAQALGYTEPDPRDDLAGVDARRKALILSRKLGRRINMEDVRVESLVPAGLEGVSLDEFWRRLPEVDSMYRAQVEEAASHGNVLRFLARIDREGASVALMEVPKQSLAGSLVGTESLFVFHTRRYGDQPLAVRGRGAGADLTASGVMADVLTLRDVARRGRS